MHPTDNPASLFPHDSKARKEIPIKSGFLDYFPAAVSLVAQVSKKGNDKHNPGMPIHWARGKSMDQLDSAVRHIMEGDALDPDTGLPVLAHAIWRLCAELQIRCEARGAPRAPAAWTPEEEAEYAKTGKLP